MTTWYELGRVIAMPWIRREVEERLALVDLLRREPDEQRRIVAEIPEIYRAAYLAMSAHGSPTTPLLDQYRHDCGYLLDRGLLIECPSMLSVFREADTQGPIGKMVQLVPGVEDDDDEGDVRFAVGGSASLRRCREFLRDPVRARFVASRMLEEEHDALGSE